MLNLQLHYPLQLNECRVSAKTFNIIYFTVNSFLTLDPTTSGRQNIFTLHYILLIFLLLIPRFKVRSEDLTYTPYVQCL